MACDRWQESGLLYVSGELSPEECVQFGRHLENCSECRSVHELYLRERKRLFTPAILGEQTSQALDRAIVEACGKAPKPIIGFRVFALLATKPVMAGVFLLLGLSAGTYMAYTIDRAGRLAKQTTPPVLSPKHMTPDTVSRTPTFARSDSKPPTRDTIPPDTIADTSPFPSSRPISASAGVVTVDLKK